MIIYGNTYLTHACLVSIVYLAMEEVRLDAFLTDDDELCQEKQASKFPLRKREMDIMMFNFFIIYLECKEFTVSSEHLKPLIIVPCDINHKYLR